MVQANSAGKTAHDDYAVPPLPVWFLADGARSVTRVGTANQVAPAATAGALWLTSYPLGADAGTAAGTAREVSLAGAPLGAPVRLPPGYVIDQATDRGLLLAPVIPQPGTTADELWDPAAPRASRTFDAVIAATPTEIAWAPAVRGAVPGPGSRPGDRQADRGRAAQGEFRGERRVQSRAVVSSRSS